MQERVVNVRPELNLFINLKNKAAWLEAQFRHFLEQVLDPEIYKLAIDDGERDEEGRYVLMGNKDDRIFYYQIILNLLIDFQKIMQPVSDIHEVSSQFLRKKGVGGKLAVIWSQGDEVNERLNTFGDYYFHFLECLETLELDIFFSDLPALANLKMWQELLSPFIKPVQEQFNHNPFVASYKKHSERGQLVCLSLPRIDAMQAALDEVLEELSREKLSDSVRKDYQKTVVLSYQLVEKINQLKQSPPHLNTLIKRVYQLYSVMKKLLASLPPTYVALNVILQKPLLATIGQINLMIRDLYLHADHFVSQHYLQEGYLLVLSAFAKKFNDWVESCGYQFEPGERYPYAEDLLRQRKKLLKSVDKGDKPYKKEFLEKRWTTLAQCFVNQNSNRAIEESLRYKQSMVIAQIDKRITELTAEISASWFTKTKNKKVDLLKKLKEQFAANPDENCQTILTNMKKNRDIGPDVSLLENGRTGKLMQTLQRLTYKPEDRVALIVQEIDKFQKEQKKARYHCFFQKSTAHLMNCVAVLEMLKNALQKPGYRVKEVLDQMSAKNPEYYRVLVQYEQALLAKLKEIDDYTPDCLLGKKRIHFSSEELELDELRRPLVAS